MKTEALNTTLIAVATVAAVWLLAGVRFDVTNVDTYIGWASAGALIAMVPMAYRSAWKRLAGR